MPGSASGGGTGTSLTKATVIVSGVAALVASLISFVSAWLQTKNYRKPLLQRYVIRILLIVPIYSASSWASLMSQDAAFYLDPLRDIYEAFTIYTFLQLLINFLGGERSLIVMTHGRPPISHPWPLNHCLSKIDISDPHTFLAIKRGILQYAWLKPILAVATIVMKLTGTYQEGYLGLSSGYLWSGIIYNISITLSLYALAIFWICMSEDLQPFRPMPKFLCIKLIIFASYWQGFFLSILQKFGAITNKVPGYTADNLAAAIQDALICFEMPLFAMAHWYAFSWHDYADTTISAARMPVKFALRDAFGPRDLIEDTKETFAGSHYEYRTFDSGDHVLAHEDSESRTARMMDGMRYARNGKGKYWIPKPGEVSSRTPLLSANNATYDGTSSQTAAGVDGENENVLEEEEERLYRKAKIIEFGDWNYPVITAHVPSADRWHHSDPNIITTTTNRKLLQPTKVRKQRHQRHARQELAAETAQQGGSELGRSDESKSKSRLGRLLRRESDRSSSSDSARSQLVDLVVEDEQAELTERVRARKEGGSRWNEADNKHFRRINADGTVGEDMREGFDPKDQENKMNTTKSKAKSTNASGNSKREENMANNVWANSDGL